MASVASRSSSWYRGQLRVGNLSSWGKLRLRGDRSVMGGGGASAVGPCVPQIWLRGVGRGAHPSESPAPGILLLPASPASWEPPSLGALPGASASPHPSPPALPSPRPCPQRRAPCARGWASRQPRGAPGRPRGTARRGWPERSPACGRSQCCEHTPRGGRAPGAPVTRGRGRGQGQRLAAVANQKPWTDFEVEGQVSGVETQGRFECLAFHVGSWGRGSEGNVRSSRVGGQKLGGRVG